MTNNERVDNYALDDTLAGRLTQAAAVGILTALPDYIKSKAGLTTAYIAGGAAFGGLVAYTNAEREEETTDAPIHTEGASLAPLLAVVALVLLSLLPSVALSRAIVKALVKRGIGKPWTLLGAVGAALTFAVSEAEARGLEKQTS